MIRQMAVEMRWPSAKQWALLACGEYHAGFWHMVDCGGKERMESNEQMVSRGFGVANEQMVSRGFGVALPHNPEVVQETHPTPLCSGHRGERRYPSLASLDWHRGAYLR